jgi:hypothetical protein
MFARSVPAAQERKIGARRRGGGISDHIATP